MSKAQKPASKGVGITTDTIAVSIYNNLLSDFRSVHPYFAHEAHSLRNGDPGACRQLGLPDYRTTLIPRFRAYYQLDSLLKKYRFQDEPLTSAELKVATYDKYNAFQAKRSKFNLKLNTVRIRLIIQRARSICRDILGKLDWNEVYQLARFGRNSSVGCNFANSYLDHKLSANEAFTSTVSAQAFFRDYLKDDPILSSLLGDKISCLHEVHPLITVPKKFDIDRTISPLTLVGLLLSHGLGRSVEQRLKLHPLHTLDITTLQQKHRFWIRKYSITRSHATLDMSFGSENITSWLLNMLLPREWYNALKLTFCRKVKQGDSVTYTESVLPMGNGATFPVETLIFYSLVRATGDLLGVSGRYSVYGDDVIVPSGAYNAVLTMFEDLGIAVNRDKSFCLEQFRESCGADYYKGAAVRPFYIPEGMKCNRRSNPRYIAWLYKCVNGLLARWSPIEVRATLTMLLSELAISTNGKVLLVPPSFPDGCGVKTPDPDIEPLPGFLFWSRPKAVFDNGSRSYSFSFLLEMPKKRVVKSTISYYWDGLRTARVGSLLRNDEEKGKMNDVFLPSPCYRDVEVDVGSAMWRSLILKDCLHYFKYITPSGLTYRRKLKTVTYKDKKGVVRKKIRVKWLALCSDKQESSFEYREAGRAPYTPSYERMDPLITDWI